MAHSPLWRILSRAAIVAATAAAGISVAAVTASQADSAPAGSIRNAGGPDAVADRYIVVLKDQNRAGVQAVNAAATDLTRSYGGSVKHVYDSALNGFSATMSQKQALALSTNDKVSYVEQVRRMYAQDTQNNPPNWGDDRIDQRNLPLNQTFTYPANPGQGVKVYVLDTGINPNHQDFTGRIQPGQDFVDNDNNPADCHGHGTHVAGTAAGTTFGIAKKANVIAIRVLNCQGSGTNDGILAGMNWVRNNGVRPAVVNYSIGCSSPCSSPALDSAVRSIVSAGIQWVQAAGNSNQDACGFSPQKVIEAITVGNTNSSDARNSSSSWGSCLDIFAPGTSIVSASHTSNTGSATMTGTSMASPHVAGAAAMYLGQNPNATSQQVRDALVTNGTPGKVTSPGSGSPNVLLYTAFMNTVTPGDVTVSNPGNQTSTVGTAVTLNNSASGGTPPYTWSATGLPAGLSISSSSGQITGTPTTEGTSTVTVTATDSSNPVKSGSATFTWTVGITNPGGCTATNDTDTQIPDLSTVESSVTISGCAGNGSASSTVAVSIVHPYVGDLRIDLVAPDGSTYLLRNRTGGSADNINQTFPVNLSGEVANGTWKLRVQDAGPQDIGHINTWTLTLGGGTPGCTGTNGNDVTIGDNTTVNSPIAISGCTGNASATSSVAVNIVHTYIGDLIVTLVAPDGSTYVLHNQAGGSADNINQTYPVNLSSEARNGTWTLRVQDVEVNDVGYINTWTLTL